jgi:hypothetical protein
VVVVVVGFVVVVVVVVVVGGDAVAGFATRASPTRVEMSTVVNGEIRLITVYRGRFTTSIYLVPSPTLGKDLSIATRQRAIVWTTAPYETPIYERLATLETTPVGT